MNREVDASSTSVLNQTGHDAGPQYLVPIVELDQDRAESGQPPLVRLVPRAVSNEEEDIVIREPIRLSVGLASRTDQEGGADILLRLGPCHHPLQGHRTHHPLTIQRPYATEPSQGAEAASAKRGVFTGASPASAGGRTHRPVHAPATVPTYRSTRGRDSPE